MSTGISRSLIALTRRIALLADHDPDVRAELRDLAEALLDLTEGVDDEPEADHDAEPEAPPEPEPARPSYPAAPPVSRLREPSAPSASSPLSAASRYEGSGSNPGYRNGSAGFPAQRGDLAAEGGYPRPVPRPVAAEPRFEPAAEAPSPGRTSWQDIELDPDMIASRCRLKAEGLRWAASRQRLLAEGVDFRDHIAPGDREIIDKAGRLPDCYLWMNSANFRPPKELTLVYQTADCFDVLADALILAISILEEAPTRRPMIQEALEILAESQSALRVSVSRINAMGDSDQLKAYHWLRNVTQFESVYLRRFMKLEDPADPGRAITVRSRIKVLHEALRRDDRERADRDRDRERDRERPDRDRNDRAVTLQFQRLRHQLSRVEDGVDDIDQWIRVVQSVESLIQNGVSPQSPEIRDALAPHVEAMPDMDEVPQGFSIALREVDRLLAAQQSAGAGDSTPAGRPSPDVEDAARLLEGRSILLVGGARRPRSYAALKAAFRLDDLIWLDSKEQGPNDFFRPAIAREDVVLVLFAVRWSPYTSDEVRADCDRAGKPMVRLAGGYHPNQVAAQILQQAGRALDRR